MKGATRYIPQAPDRILDAPDICDDYCEYIFRSIASFLLKHFNTFDFSVNFSDLNLIDWGPNNILAVALGTCVYLWNAASGSIDQLLELESNDYVSSLSWIQAGEGEHLAVGTSLGTIQVSSNS